jgi:hypothetical protein
LRCRRPRTRPRTCRGDVVQSRRLSPSIVDFVPDSDVDAHPQATRCGPSTYQIRPRHDSAPCHKAEFRGLSFQERGQTGNNDRLYRRLSGSVPWPRSPVFEDRSPPW